MLIKRYSRIRVKYQSLVKGDTVSFFVTKSFEQHWYHFFSVVSLYEILKITHKRIISRKMKHVYLIFRYSNNKYKYSE